MKKEKMLHFGLIGFGRWGRHYGRLLQEIPGVCFRQVAVNSRESAQNVKRFLPASVAIADNAETIFSDPSIDCVVIATPVSTHASLADQALKSGKHVLVEKPMTRTCAEARRLAALAKRSKKILMVGYQYLYHDSIAVLKEMIEGGGLGKIRWMAGEHLVSLERDDVGVFLDAGVHLLSLVRHLSGAATVMRAAGEKKEKNGMDFSVSAIVFFDALLGFFVCSREGIRKTRRITIMGDKGIAVFDDSAGDGLVTVSLKEGIKNPVPDYAPREPLRSELEHFIACVRSGKQPVTNAEFGLAIQEWAERILEPLKDRASLSLHLST